MTPKQDRESDIVRVRHMLEGCQELLQFTKRSTRKDLDKNRMLALAIVKEIEIIGEASNKISPEFQIKHPEVPWQAIAATRHRLVHGYFDINWDIVWKTVQAEIPKLLEQLEDILRKEKTKPT